MARLSRACWRDISSKKQTKEKGQANACPFLYQERQPHISGCLCFGNAVLNFQIFEGNLPLLGAKSVIALFRGASAR